MENFFPIEQLTLSICFLNRGGFSAGKIISNRLAPYRGESKYMSSFSNKLSVYRSITLPLDCYSQTDYVFIEGTAWIWFYFSDGDNHGEFSVEVVGEQLQVVSSEVLLVFCRCLTFVVAAQIEFQKGLTAPNMNKWTNFSVYCLSKKSIEANEKSCLDHTNNGQKTAFTKNLHYLMI